jgi:prepilin signal peptidase PulO-like enzyme (type II secretory pathway)
VKSAIELVVFVAGLFLGVFINYAIYAWAFFPRSISPWQRPPAGIAPRNLIAYTPVLGWWFRRSESTAWGRAFWIRPMLLEILVPVLLVLLYRAMMDGLTIPLAIRIPAEGIAAGGGGVTPWELHIQFLAYSVVLALLTVASFIDIDERTIPDVITVPGTCIGLVASAFLPGWCLWEVPESDAPGLLKILAPMHANSPDMWDSAWDQTGLGGASLWIGCLVWCVWCLSLGNLRWIARRGFRKALEYGWVGFWRSPNLPMILGLLLVGTALIGAAYFGLSPDRWRQLFSGLLGIGLGGLLVWSFRIVAGGVLRREALGFGDVTLMAMVGAHFGWQIVLVAFFLAPLFGIALVIVYWIVTRDTKIFFGPFLAAATAYLMLDWARVWDVVAIFFVPLNIYLMFLAGVLVLLGSLLWVTRTVKEALLGGKDSP